MPSTTISWFISSMPAEALARPDQSAVFDADVRVGDASALELAERDRDAERARGARQAHRFQRVARRDGLAAAFGVGDALRGEQRALDLHEVHVGRIGDLRVGHRGAHAVRDDVDLREAAELLGPERRRMRAADGERGPLPASLGALEHGPVRRHRALGAAGHHEADVLRARAEVLLQHQRRARASRSRA